MDTVKGIDYGIESGLSLTDWSNQSTRIQIDHRSAANGHRFRPA